MAKGRVKKIFDIIPATFSGNFESGEIDLKNKQETEKEPIVEIRPERSQVSGVPEQSGLDNLVSEIINPSPKEELTAMLEVLGEPVAELASIGARVNKDKLKNREQNKEEQFYEKIISHIQMPAPAAEVTVKLASVTAKPAVPSLNSTQNSLGGGVIKEEFIIGKLELESEKEARVADFYNKSAGIPKATAVSYQMPVIDRKPLNFAPQKKKSFSAHFFVILALVGIFSYGLTIKNELVRESSLAVSSLEEAKNNLEGFDFKGATENFEKSYHNFTQASQNLNLIGGGLAGIFSNLPGFSKISSAKDIVGAGKLLAKSGQEMSQALILLSETGAVLNPHDKHKIRPASIISKLKTALELSSRNFNQAKALISNVDESVIPEDKKTSYLDFKEKLPLLEKTLVQATGYVDFLEGVIGIDNGKKYLLLFNNYSELRPIGGFPGTYGVVSFAGGGLSDFFVNDVYNLDGQLKRNIIPPKQLQHITPTWGMRDAGWFIDFPTSAIKTMSFFAEEAGYPVDGVIALNPDVIAGILRVVGPIEMPDYDLILTADNFLASIQEEVEYGDNRIQPKKIVVDLAPRLLEKLYSASSEDWMKIFNSLIAGIEDGDMLFYFNDKELENFVVNNGFGGEAKQTGGDYLSVNFSNVKGSKTDVVTDNYLQIDSQLVTRNSPQPVIKYAVSITREHKGGDYAHGFYNKQNPAYVRVLMPKNAKVLSISGHDSPNFKPLVNYGILDFEKDRELSIFESGFSYDKTLGADRFEEAGKQGLGFWMITDPKSFKTIKFEYEIPITGDEYSLYFQNQPGLDWKNFVFKITDHDELIKGSLPVLNKVGGVYIFEDKIGKDFELQLKF